jgi:HlyD family secretion protein
LRIIQESEGVVPPGAPLIEIGHPGDLEIIADLLSTEAVRVSPGARVRIDGWGGEPVEGKVARVDPAGFLKVSALGIEEQRVRTVIDFTAPPDKWARLGHDFRVIVHVTVWQSADALTVPVAALFRQGDDWAVFVDQDGVARTRVIKVGQRNARVAEVRSGMMAGERVVLHPSDRIKDGTSVTPRPSR